VYPPAAIFNPENPTMTHSPLNVALIEKYSLYADATGMWLHMGG